MKLSKKAKIELFSLLIILNIILRFQVVPNEIFPDSFIMHIMVNSLNEFGYAKWFLHPLSIIGLYPASYSSSMQFLLSTISQTTGLEMRWVIFLYCVFIGLLSMFTAYSMAGVIINDDLFKFLVAFAFSTSPGLLAYTTWTIPTRGLFVVLAPLLIYLLLKCRLSIKYIPLTFILATFLFATHHLFYFLIPSFLIFLVLVICFKLRSKIEVISKKRTHKLTPFIPVCGFLCMYSIPFFTGHFIEGSSRYAPVWEGHIRYIGVLIIPAIGGLLYLIFKQIKTLEEWFILLSAISLITFIYIPTYLKWFLPIFVIPLSCVGLVNIMKLKGRRSLFVVVVFLLLALCFSSYYQFIHFLPSPGMRGMHERYMEDSTYLTGRWMKYHLNGSAISNDLTLGRRIFAASETSYVLTGFTTCDLIYNFIHLNLSEFRRYPITSEEFWFDGYEGPDVGERTWHYIHRYGKVRLFNISYILENKECGGNVYWHHGNFPSEPLHLAYDSGSSVYDCGNINIWRVNV